jgi:molecular chaperone GrpE
MSGKTNDNAAEPNPDGARSGQADPGSRAPADDPVGPDIPEVDESTSVENPASKRTRVEQLIRERDDYLENLKRERASFLNYKRWVEKERRNAETVAVCRFVEKLLPFIDDLDRARKAAIDATDVESLKEGFDMVFRRFHESVKAASVEEVPSSGELFDPKIHEAILQIEDPGHPSGTILETTHRGFCLGDRLIRAARVVVSKNPQTVMETRSTATRDNDNNIGDNSGDDTGDDGGRDESHDEDSGAKA